MTRLARGLAAVAMVALASVFVFPFLWMLLATFKADPELFRALPLLPERFTLDHFRALLDGRHIPFARQLANSLAVASLQTMLALLLGAPAGYVFGRHQFRGKRWLFASGLLAIVLPQQVLVLPLLTWFHRVGLYDTLAALVLPGIASGLGLVFFTLVFARLPGELADLARAEGASEARVFLTLVGVVRPALVAFAFVHFVLCWHEHLVPLVMAGSPENKTVPVALASLYGSTIRFPYGLLMAGSLLASLPPVLLFWAVRRRLRSALEELVLP
jgi:ABC-type glycerol-3-phosphate transport system permease component